MERLSSGHRLAFVAGWTPCLRICSPRLFGTLLRWCCVLFCFVCAPLLVPVFPALRLPLHVLPFASALYLRFSGATFFLFGHCSVLCVFAAHSALRRALAHAAFFSSG
jgi:hypothetical protein